MIEAIFDTLLVLVGLVFYTGGLWVFACAFNPQCGDRPAGDK
jgi:hypothetical protein